MAKKSFKDNPALRFISAAEEEPEAEQTPQEKAPAERTAPKGYYVNPYYIEKKSKRLQLVLQPSLYERVKAKAAELGISVNEFCHQALDKATREE